MLFPPTTPSHLTPRLSVGSVAVGGEGGQRFGGDCCCCGDDERDAGDANGDGWFIGVVIGKGSDRCGDGGGSNDKEDSSGGGGGGGGGGGTTTERNKQRGESSGELDAS